MRILVITSAVHPPVAGLAAGVAARDFADPEAWRIAVRHSAHLARPADAQVVGPGLAFVRQAVATLRDLSDGIHVDLAFCTPGFGIVRADEPLVPCAMGFDDLAGMTAARWRERVGFEEAFAYVTASYDLVFFLPAEGGKFVAKLGPCDGTLIVFAGKSEAKPMAERADHVVMAGLDAAVAHGVKVTDLRGYYLAQIARGIAQDGRAALEALREAPHLVEAWLLPTVRTAAAAYTFQSHEITPTKPRVRFFMPECDDRVDPGYDFLGDRQRPGRCSDMDDAFAHDPEVYGAPSYDGMLVSKCQIEERPYKRQFIEAVGVHRYLRVPREFPVMGDCGAFTYVGEPSPPYKTTEILSYYEKFGFDLGVSIDHLIIPPVYTRTSWRIRRLDGSTLELTKTQYQALVRARKAEPSVIVREDQVTYFPELGMVAAERKQLVGTGDAPATYPEALAELAQRGLELPFSASRFARLRTRELHQAPLELDDRGIRPFIEDLRAIIDDRRHSEPRFKPLDRVAYDDLLRQKAERRMVAETLRAERIVYYPESEDAVEETTAVDPDVIRYRFLITLWNGRQFLRFHRKKGYGFVPIGAIQGWHGPMFRYAVRQFLRMGYQYLAIGGLAMARTEEILEVLRAVQPELSGRSDPPDVHLFGVARGEQVEEFIGLGITSFDSTGPLRKAWLNATSNYVTLGGQAYAALRIPNPLSSPRAKAALTGPQGLSLERMQELEQAALRLVRAYDAGEAGLEETLDAVMAYDGVFSEDRDFRPLFRRTLIDRPWQHCPCRICKTAGVEVIIFRGNDRNRRRGFHNTWVFYQMLQQRLRHSDVARRQGLETNSRSSGRAVQLSLELPE